MPSLLQRLLPWGIALVLAHPALAGKEKSIALSEVPDEILAVAQEKYLAITPPVITQENQPDPQLISANTETEPKGGYLYEIQGRLPDGRQVEFDIYQDQRVQEIEIEFTRDMVPGAVLKTIERKLPGFEPTFIEASHSPSLKVVCYEFVGKLGDTELDLDVSADGRHVEVADR